MKKMQFSRIKLVMVAFLALSTCLNARNRDNVMNSDHEGRILGLEVQGLKQEDKFNFLETELGTSPNHYRKAWIYYEMSKLYVSIYDMREALVWAQKAHETDKSNREIKSYYRKLKKKVDPKPTMAQRLRVFNRSKDLTLTTGYVLEYASNVVQEAIDPTTPTDKEDFSFNLNLGLKKNWKARVYKFTQETSLNSANFFYFENDELNLLSNTLAHQFNYNQSNGKDYISSFFKLGLNHIVSDVKPLFLAWDASVGVFYNDESTGVLYDFYGSYRNSNYFSDANIAQEGDNVTISLGAFRHLDSKKSKSLRLGLTQIFEDPNGSTEQYDEFGVDVNFEKNYNNRWLKSVAPFLTLKWRRYKGADTGLPAREDQQWEVGLTLSKQLFKMQTLDFRASALENESNIASSHYRVQKFSLNYQIIY